MLILATVERQDRVRSHKIANDNVIFEFAFFSSQVDGPSITLTHRVSSNNSQIN
jgi:hypothetical protein